MAFRDLRARRGVTAPGVIHVSDRKLQMCGTPWPPRRVGPRTALTGQIAP